jgi:HEAT repeat protein
MNSKVALLLLVLLTITSLGLAAEPAKEVRLLNREIAVENYLTGLESENSGLMTSSAYYLGELKSEEAVIPLMKILKSSDEEQLRIAAALALLKIGDEKGIYAIKKAIRFDESKRVSDICAKFYNDYLTRNYTPEG